MSGNTVYKSRSIDTSFDPPLYSLDSAFKKFLLYGKLQAL